MTIKVAIAGASGYAGGEILRLLVGHPRYLDGSLRIAAVTGASSSGRTLGEAQPHVPELAGMEVRETSAETLERNDVVFLALPHGHSGPIAEALGERALIIDCAADFRLRSAADWREFYGTEHAGTWPYGLPEFGRHRDQLVGTKRVAVPGCFPTGATLAAAPAVARGLVRPDISVVSVSGVSGAGKKAQVALLGAQTMGNLRAYNVAGRHRHTPEIEQNLAELTNEPVQVSFTPVLAPLPRGILSTVQAPLADGVSVAAVREAYVEACCGEPFVQVLEPGVQPETANVLGSNLCQVQVDVDTRARRLVATLAIDNLTKGTAGAAIQCMNLALGWEERSGLPRAAVAP